MRRLITLLLLIAGLSTYAATQNKVCIDLSGTWLFALDPEGTVSPAQPFTDPIQLPGTTDTNRKGYVNQKQDETTHLTRHFWYKGKAWYSRTVEIPASWKGHSQRMRRLHAIRRTLYSLRRRIFRRHAAQ